MLLLTSNHPIRIYLLFSKYEIQLQNPQSKHEKPLSFFQASNDPLPSISLHLSLKSQSNTSRTISITSTSACRCKTTFSSAFLKMVASVPIAVKKKGSNVPRKRYFYDENALVAMLSLIRCYKRYFMKTTTILKVDYWRCYITCRYRVNFCYEWTLSQIVCNFVTNVIQLVTNETHRNEKKLYIFYDCTHSSQINIRAMDNLSSQIVINSNNRSFVASIIYLRQMYCRLKKIQK